MWRINGIIRSLCIRESYEGYPRVDTSQLQQSSVWVLVNGKVKSSQSDLNTDSPPPSQYFSQQLVSEQVLLQKLDRLKEIHRNEKEAKEEVHTK